MLDAKRVRKLRAADAIVRFEEYEIEGIECQARLPTLAPKPGYITITLFLTMLLNVSFSGVLGMLSSMNSVGPRQMGMMRRLFVMARFMMFRSFTVMPASMCVMFR